MGVQFMNEVLKAIKERRSIRKFKDEMPDIDLINQVIEAGLYAPSGKNLQTTLIICVTNKELRDKISKDNCTIGGYDPDSDPFYGAPVILIVVGDANNPNIKYDGALVLENMMLAAHSLGLGGIWINRARQEFERDDYKKILKDLNIEGEYEGIGHLALGFVDGKYPDIIERKQGRVYYID